MGFCWNMLAISHKLLQADLENGLPADGTVINLTDLDKSG